MLTVHKLRVDYLKNPIGIDTSHPRISWQLRSDQRDVLQSAYQIQISADCDFASVLADSGEVTSDRSVHVELPQLLLKSCKRYHFRVRIWAQGQKGASAWSEPAYWEMGLLRPDEWEADWIAAPLVFFPPENDQSPLLRHTFQVSDGVKQARIYATALGSYELELNGRRVGESYFTPGWTSYKHRLQYQTYDVTDMLVSGVNAVGAMLGNGWYKGNLGWQNHKNLYGDRTALLFQLHIEYKDGSEQRVVSDGSWKAAPAPIVYSELYHGETYDARLEKPGWSTAGFEETEWAGVEVLEETKEKLIAQENEPVRKIDEVKPIELITTPKGERVLDMGQNMVGWVRFSVRSQPGRELKLLHAEVLDAEGNFYTANLRSAKQTVRYIAKGEPGGETYEPRFSFQGFRYVQLIGFEEPIRLEDFTGVVLHSAMEQTGHFACSEPLINQLQHNILWGQKGNFLDVPTDCPQRDERMGWTGDAQMFIRTASYLMNVAPFFGKWLGDLKTDQLDNGGVPFVIPHVLDENSHSSAAWGDAAVICPWTVYQSYGDTRILERQYDSMKAWVNYIRSQGGGPDLWNTGFHFGDWLGLDSKPDTYIGATDTDLIATAFYAYSTRLLAKSAAILGKTADAAEYEELHGRIRAAFQQEFITPNGRLSVPTQTAAVLALMFDLVDGRAKERTIGKLLQLLEESKFHLTTGFVGTPYLNLVLSEAGHTDAAYRLLFQKDYPSWLYPITKGATTIWEHWDGIKEDGSFWSTDMNSFNHYAYGAIGDWLYRCVAGINPDEKQPGYKRISIKPQPGAELSWAEASLESMYGLIESSWLRGENGTYQVKVTVPPNATAAILLPESGGKPILESGTGLAHAAGIHGIVQTEEGVLLEAGSGSYHFTY